MSAARIGVVVAAAGAGTRMDTTAPKQYALLAGRPLLEHALRPFLARADVSVVLVSLPAGDVATPPPWLTALDPRIRIVAGGEARCDSVWHALEALPDDVEIVLVHDAARPLVTPEIVARVIAEAGKGHGAVPAVPVTDTIKQVGPDGAVLGTPDRSALWRAQTPQGFPAAMLVGAYRSARQRREPATDDAMLAERAGGRVVIVEGSPDNLKVTRASDLALAEAILSARMEARAP
ncbi:MAG: 2-C-methyl-D-erythritol 4-phosphate cytidylyltransferase [Longimicrobiales bacterium]